MLTPYGWHLYHNVWITLRDPALMANVTEWRPVAALPLAQLQPFLLLTGIVFGSLLYSRRRAVGDGLALLALWVQALLHARHIALFALGGLVIAAPHLRAALQQIRGRARIVARAPWQAGLLAGFALLYALTVALVSVVRLRRAIGPLGYSREGIGAAVAEAPSYPRNACAFVAAQGFPAGLRVFNNFEIGGYLMWRLPQEPVFTDGRLDVYAGRAFDEMLALSRVPGGAGWAARARREDFDCVITTSGRQARAFAAQPDWQLVYADPPDPRRQRCRILLRRRPQFAALIARCLGAPGKGVALSRLTED